MDPVPLAPPCLRFSRNRLAESRRFIVTFVLFGMDAVGECSNVGVGCDSC